MSNTSIVSENHYIIANSSVATFKTERLSVEFTNHKKEPLKLSFVFVADKEKQQSIEARVPEDKSELNIIIYNASGIGGSVAPLDIANDPDTGKHIYLILSFQQISDSFVIQYTIFEDK